MSVLWKLINQKDRMRGFIPDTQWNETLSGIIDKFLENL